jgi:hypothetical protein
MSNLFLTALPSSPSDSYRLRQNYIQMANWYKNDVNFVSWNLAIKPTTFRIQVPPELGVCKIIDFKTGIILGNTDNCGLFEMPLNLFNILPSDRFISEYVTFKSTGDLEYYKMIDWCHLIITADRQRVDDLILLKRNYELNNVHILNAENSFINCICTRENVILKHEDSAHLRL